ncbi:MAG: hypothetical protein U0794_14765 [Isosphaeraceae bacterium]
MAGLALPVDRFPSLAIGLRARAQGLRGGGGATATVFFLDDDGRILPGFETGIRALTFAGNFDWRDERTAVRVPPARPEPCFSSTRPTASARSSSMT